MHLTTLLRAISPTHIDGSIEIRITGLAYDSRLVRPGSVFVAVPSIGGIGTSGGFEHIAEAIERGAVAIVSEARAPDGDVCRIIVPNARAVLADLAAEYFGHPSRAMHLFAVTGTDGKTTTTYLLEQILASAGKVTGLIGTVEIKIAGRRERNLDRMTTPESLDVQRLLAEMRDSGVTHAALEASSHALSLDRLRACSFTACAITNITADHVEFHGSWEAYFAAKARLFTEVAPGVPAILNRDDAHYERWRKSASGGILTYSIEQEADLRASNIRAIGSGTGFTLNYQNAEVDISLRLAGRYNVSNALAAAGLAIAEGMNLADVAGGLNSAGAPPGRMQRIDLGQPFEVIVDYAHTEHAFRSVLATLRERTGGSVIAVFGATGSRDRKKRPVLARIAHDYADFSYITNEDPYGEDVEAIIDEVVAGMPPGAEGSRFQRVVDRGEAIESALRRARPGDTVVILGKGHEQSMVVAGEKKPWSDSDAVRHVLEVSV